MFLNPYISSCFVLCLFWSLHQIDFSELFETLNRILKKSVQDKTQNCTAHTTIITTNNSRSIQTSDAHERTTAYYNGWCAVSQAIGLLHAYTYNSFSTEQVASHLIFDSSFSTITIYNKNVADRNRIVCMREK